MEGTIWRLVGIILAGLVGAYAGAVWFGNMLLGLIVLVSLNAIARNFPALKFSYSGLVCGTVLAIFAILAMRFDWLDRGSGYWVLGPIALGLVGGFAIDITRCFAGLDVNV